MGSVPFSLTGNTVAFTVPAAELGWTGGAWSANLYSLSYGDLTAQQTASSVPTPPAFWGGLAGLAVVAGCDRSPSARRRDSAPAYRPHRRLSRGPAGRRCAC